jgi:hypothetical protein
MRLSQLLASDSQIELQPAIAKDVSDFLVGIAADTSYDPAHLRIRASSREIVDRIAKAYGVGSAA